MDSQSVSRIGFGSRTSKPIVVEPLADAGPLPFRQLDEQLAPPNMMAIENEIAFGR